RHAVLDADALNALASDSQLQTLLRARAHRQRATVLTPHPLEAARLLGSTVEAVQQDRLGAAETLARRFDCTVVLKGSGSIVAAPPRPSVVNATGNARLATAGTGDVLAGLIGAALAAGQPAYEAACQAVYHHGRLADRWPATQPLTAGALARAVDFSG
ncbi:MAG: NAD(P)H-hydrate dehydratase, partial [Hylemonella sp.]|nr:NAD(P)H-hydrate dehydratase [Hylemonella sp.]